MSNLNGPSLRGDIGCGCNAELLAAAQAMPLESADFVGTPKLDFEGWRAFLSASCGNQPNVVDPSVFTGWMRPISACGLAAAALKIECGFAATDFGRWPVGAVPERRGHATRCGRCCIPRCGPARSMLRW
jgi:hypothetical protein